MLLLLLLLLVPRDAIRLNRNQLGQQDVAVIKQVTNMWYNPKTPEELRVARERRLERERLQREMEAKMKERVKALKAKLKKKASAQKDKKKKKKKTNKLKPKKKATKITKAKTPAKKKTEDRGVFGITLLQLVQKNLIKNGTTVFVKYKPTTIDNGQVRSSKTFTNRSLSLLQIRS